MSEQKYAESIPRKDALKIIYSGEICCIEFVTLDLARRTGGIRIKLPQAVNSGENHDSRKNGTIGMKSAVNTGHPYSIHIPLILRVNNMKVL